MTERDTDRHFLIPKRGGADDTLPAMGSHQLAFVIGALAPTERRALMQIAETADLLETSAGPFMLVPVDADLIDMLAAVGAETDDRESDLQDEPDEGREPEAEGGDAYKLNAKDRALRKRLAPRKQRIRRLTAIDTRTGDRWIWRPV